MENKAIMGKFKGLGVALVTPFSENGNVDYVGLQRLVELQIQGGIDVVVHGTTGESGDSNERRKGNHTGFH